MIFHCLDILQFTNPSPTEECFDCFQILAIMNTTAINTMFWCLCGHKFAIPLGKSQRVWLLYWVTNPNLSSEVAVLFCIPTSKESSCCSTLSPEFGVSSGFGCPNRCVVVPCCIDLNSSDDIGWGHLFISLLAICVYSLVMKSLAYFSTEFFFFFSLLRFKSSSNIFLIRCVFWKYFLPAS